MICIQEGCEASGIGGCQYDNLVNYLQASNPVIELHKFKFFLGEKPEPRPPAFYKFRDAIIAIIMTECKFNFNIEAQFV